MILRSWVAALASSATLLAQQSIQENNTWTIDVNGHRVEAPVYSISESPVESQRVERAKSINGRMVPIQSFEDSVVRQDSKGKVVVRMVRKYDATGNLGLPLKSVIEEKKNPDGSTTIQSTSYEADINGNMQLYERSTTQIRKGAATETSTTVERATLNGALQPVERSTSVERPTAGDRKSVV